MRQTTIRQTKVALVAIAVVALALIGPAQARASTITVTFDILTSGGATLADGSFSFDSSLDGGVLGYADLSAFDFTFTGSGASFDLTFINSGGFEGPFWNFEFDTSTDTFVFSTANPAGSPLAAIKAGYSDGFWVGNNTAVGDYSSGVPVNIGTWASVNTERFEVSAVPEPATLLLLGTGLGAVAARRRLKKRA